MTSLLYLCTFLCLILVSAVSGQCPDFANSVEFTEYSDYPLYFDSQVVGEIYFEYRDDVGTNISIQVSGKGFQISRVLDEEERIVNFQIVEVNEEASLSSKLSPFQFAHFLLIALIPFFFGSRNVSLLILFLGCILAISPILTTLSCEENYVAIKLIVPTSYSSSKVQFSETLTVGFLDPSPNQNTPGVFSCEGCPSSNFTLPLSKTSEETVEVENGIVEGVRGDGVWYLLSLGESGTKRQQQPTMANSGVINTNNNTGEYSFVAPLFCGTQILKRVWNNENGQLVIVTEVVVENCIEADIKVTLSWSQIGNDWDLHFIRAGGCRDTSEDTYYANSVSSWGAQLDVDCIDQCTLENIFFSSEEEKTSYYVYVHLFSGRGDFPGSVTINTGTGDFRFFQINSLTTEWLMVAQISWNSRTNRWEIHDIQRNGDSVPCPSEPKWMITLADRKVECPICQIAYHYSIQLWRNVDANFPFSQQIDLQTIQGARGIKEDSVELLKEDGYKAWKVNRGCWEEKNIAISRIHYSDRGTKMKVLVSANSESEIRNSWNAILSAAQNYQYAEQPSVPPPFEHFPYSIYQDYVLDGFRVINSNTFARTILRSASVPFEELPGIHPGVDSPSEGTPASPSNYSESWGSGETPEPIPNNGTQC